jgi:hypothetical protein
LGKGCGINVGENCVFTTDLGKVVVNMYNLKFSDQNTIRLQIYGQKIKHEHDNKLGNMQ